MKWISTAWLTACSSISQGSCSGRTKRTCLSSPDLYHVTEWAGDSDHPGRPHSTHRPLASKLNASLNLFYTTLQKTLTLTTFDDWAIQREPKREWGNTLRLSLLPCFVCDPVHGERPWFGQKWAGGDVIQRQTLSQPEQMFSQNVSLTHSGQMALTFLTNITQIIAIITYITF